MTELEHIMRRIREKKKPGERFLISIDGRCAAGKTTFAGELGEKLECAVFHMDDFFLSSDLRTKERLDTPGENVDHERFLKEILIPLRKGEERITLHAFDCKSQSFMPPAYIPAGEICIIEGAYSNHPDLWDYYDLHLFMDISPEGQQSRIRKRNGEDGLEVFLKRWIPLEEKYFMHYNLKDKCDYSFTTE
jgi:uridine kinase